MTAAVEVIFLPTPGRGTSTSGRSQAGLPTGHLDAAQHVGDCGPLSMHPIEAIVPRTICTAAKVPPIRLHDARHTCGTLMHLQGVPTAVISARLGHADSTSTTRTYMHSQDDSLTLAAAGLRSVVTTRDSFAGSCNEKSGATNYSRW
ncbi:tyrosine-type recombinase/integrase [Rhodococcus sp. PvR044]|uniref:tyrosine-type recombinase/integrase n=1 Tax=Rhodococcus sp. PvR044 TaxID=3156402 RepID=UPI00211CEC90